MNSFLGVGLLLVVFSSVGEVFIISRFLLLLLSLLLFLLLL